MIKFQQRHAMLNAGVIDQYPNWADVILDPIHRFDNLELLRDVKGSREHPIGPVPLEEDVLSFVQRCRVLAVEYHGRTRIGQPRRQRTADTAARTGYQSDPAAEVECVQCCSPSMSCPADLTFCSVSSSTTLMRMRRPFEEIVTEHGPTVLRVCRALLGRQDADDAWSETFLAALRAYPDLADGANVEAWLVTIAHHKTIDALRAERRRAIPVADIVESSSTSGSPEPPDDDLWAALRSLPPKQRQAVAYHHVAGLPYAEVAAIVGGSIDAARRAAHDGIHTLRRRYRSSPNSTPSEGTNS